MSLFGVYNLSSLVRYKRNAKLHAKFINWVLFLGRFKFCDFCFNNSSLHDYIRINFCTPDLCNTLSVPFSSLQCAGSYCCYVQHVTSFCSLFFRTRRDMTRMCSSKYFVPISLSLSLSLFLQCAAHNTAIHYIDRRHLSPSLWILILTSGGIAGFFPIFGQTLGVWRDLPSLHTVLGYLKGSGSTLIVKTWGFSRGSIFSGESSVCCTVLNWQKLPTWKERVVNFPKHQQLPL
jgi:hypothetical protein